ncbi:anti-sigma factor [Sphingopyxis panaciterrae]
MDDDLTPEEVRDALAAELALGVLDGQERADALRRTLSDPGFAALVRDWEDRLAPLHGQSAEISPPESTWTAIARRIDGAPDHEPVLRRLRFWRAGAMVSGAVAAALALLLVTRPAAVPDPVAVTPQTVAVARIEGDGKGPIILARYDQASGAMTLRIEGFDPGALAPELWVIPAGGDPVSLGQIDRSGTANIALPAAHRPLLRDGATLAITMEPASSVPHRAPSSAPVAAGKITII